MGLISPIVITKFNQKNPLLIHSNPITLRNTGGNPILQLIPKTHTPTTTTTTTVSADLKLVRSDGGKLKKYPPRGDAHQSRIENHLQNWYKTNKQNVYLNITAKEICNMIKNSHDDEKVMVACFGILSRRESREDVLLILKTVVESTDKKNAENVYDAFFAACYWTLVSFHQGLSIYYR